MQHSVLVTGGAGFIGSNFVRLCVLERGIPVINVDKLTYAGNLGNVRDLEQKSGYSFLQADINDGPAIRDILRKFQPSAIVHFAAESHVDRSILGPDEFIQTNIHGTFQLLEEAKAYWNELSGTAKAQFRFLHVSTDEVFGSLKPDDPAFSESTPYAPNSPYSASKAASDHLVRAYHHTYAFPTLTTNCSNNYGPYQFPEKLIPLMIANGLSGKKLPVYGDGLNVRDWLYVTDHCEAILQVLQKGRIGETYNIGGCAEMTNLDVVNTICRTLDELRPRPDGTSHASLINFVKDRPGHDRRYAMDIRKIRNELGWSPKESFATGIRKTVSWYLDNSEWVESVTSGAYRDWMRTQYAGR
ncbi:MAG TPA: dTDP-glucose 4,6-dehydratase [Terriglobales bacterium]|nr:dTDP-glucose 4,6-dehydratase [Terriglobales bacterium]